MTAPRPGRPGSLCSTTRAGRSRLAGEPADVLLSPRLAHVGLFDYHRGEEAIEEGREAVRVMQPAILRALGRN